MLACSDIMPSSLYDSVVEKFDLTTSRRQTYASVAAAMLRQRATLAA